MEWSSVSVGAQRVRKCHANPMRGSARYGFRFICKGDGLGGSMR
jgi:hypothetical protein